VDNLYVGAGASPARYVLQSGTLTVNTDENNSDSGVFNQTGGTHSVGQSLIAYTYTLGGTGVLGVTGDCGVFNFAQTGGTHTVGGALSIVTGYAFSGASSLHVTGDEDLGVLSGSPASFTQTGGTHEIDGTLSIATVSADAATYNLSSGALAAHAIAIAGPGALSESGGTLKVSSVALIAGGKMTIAAGASPTLYLDSLSIDSSSALDLNDADLIVNNGDFSTIHNLVLTGYRDQIDAAATGIVSGSGQDAGGSAMLMLFDNALVGITDWPQGSGQSIGADAIVGKYTYFGDTNLDGQVTAADYNAVDASLGMTGVDPGIAVLYGDSNFDDAINAADYNAVDAGLGLGVGDPLSAASVPEPAAVGLLGLAGMVACRRRRKR
jgi:hypothetical protein